ncbi:MAG: hypothetical protein AAFU81_13945 [Pseudomonadota bacterium]
MKALFFTQDLEVEVTIFVLRAIKKYIPAEAIQFIVPYSDPAVAQAIETAVPNLNIKTCRMPAAAPETMRGLLEQAGDDSWVMWLNCDRLPVAYNQTVDFTKLVRAVEGGAADRFAAIKLVFWREMEEIREEPPATDLVGALFWEVPYSKFGFWHPHFIRTEVLRDNIERHCAPGGFRKANALVAEHMANLKLTFLLPKRPIVKCEETLLVGKLTLNFESRRRRTGLKPTLTENIYGMMAGFTSPKILPKSNGYWFKRPYLIEKSLAPLPTDVDFYFASFGGVGSKILCQSVYAARGVQDRSALSGRHGHRRLPWPHLGGHQTAVYVFGDPRNAVISFFGQRLRRHSRHGMGAAQETGPGRADWVVQHMFNIEVPTGPLDESWDIARFLSQSHDLFRLEEHLDGWLYADAAYPVTFLRYETLWKPAAVIARHFGLSDLPLPKQTQRSSDWLSLPKIQQDAMTEMYGAFSERLAALPDAFVAHGTKIVALEGLEETSTSFI